MSICFLIKSKRSHMFIHRLDVAISKVPGQQDHCGAASVEAIHHCCTLVLAAAATPARRCWRSLVAVWYMLARAALVTHTYVQSVPF